MMLLSIFIMNWIHFLFGWGFVLFACYQIPWCAWKLWLGARSRKWPWRYGRVTSVNLDSRVGDGEGADVKFLPRIRYTYEVDGVQFENKRGVHTVIEYWTSKDKAERAAAEYAVGQQVPVYYNPWNPAYSVLKPGADPSYIWMIPACAVLLVIGLEILGFTQLHKLAG
jgi:hypothetical protein